MYKSVLEIKISIRRWLLLYLLLSAVIQVPCATLPANALPATKRLDQCRLDTWGIRDGLPGYDITSLAQTPDGFLWIGTTQGLLRFDGTSFSIFNSNNVPGLASNTIRTLALARNGDLLVGAEWCGFGRMRDGAYHRANFPDDHWNATRYFHESPDGTLWIGYQGYHFILRERHGVVQKLDIPGLYLTGVVDIPGGVLVSTLYGGLFTIDASGHAIPYNTAPAIPDVDFTAMIKTPDGSIWCATDAHGLYRIQGHRSTHYSTSDGLCSNSIHCLFVDDAHRLWIGTNYGIASYDARQPLVGLAHPRDARGFHNFGIGDGLAAGDVTAIDEDREGNLWVATGIYLNRFANTRLTAISIGSRDVQEVGGIAPRPDGSLLYSARSGLWSIPSTPDRVPRQIAKWPMRYAISGPHGDIYAFWTPASGVWLAGHLSGGKWQEQKFSFEPLTLARVGDDVYIVGIHQEIQKFGSSIHSLVFPIAPDNQFYDVQADRHGTLWIGSNAGLAYFRNGKGGVADCGLPKSAHVLSVDTSDPKYLWLGTDKGIARVEGNAYTNGTGRVTGLRGTLYGVDAGIPSNDCLQILRDHSGAIWVGGYFGIMSVEPDQFVAYDQHRIRALRVRIYTAADGIHYYPGVMMPARTDDGTLWFMGTRGVTMIDPEHMEHNPLAPPVVIEDAMANSRPLSLKGIDKVKPGDGSLFIRYAGLSYVEPERVKFRYRLEGFDTSWINAGTRLSAAYTNLPPGRYTFRVIACNNDGVWNSDGAALTFVLLPHFYETMWFRALISALAAMAIVALILARTRRMERHARDLEVKVAERTSELVDTNRQLTTVQQELKTQNIQLQESQAEVEAQNDELHAMQAELMAQNDELQAVQAELEAQNQELTETQEVLANANARLEALATTDGLTGLYNHRTFHELLEREWARAERYGAPLSLILLDVDKFKQFNDTFGHPEGDEVLRSVARILKSTVREADLVARYGGEEFVVIAPNTPAAEAVDLAERLRAAIAGAAWPLREITGSFGIASVNVSTPVPAHLIANADAALYESKNSGRNRVTEFNAHAGSDGLLSATEQKAA